MKRDGTAIANLSNLTTLDDEDRSPVWSPDGTMIAFVRGNQQRSERRGFVAHADGSGLTDLSLAPGSDDTDPAWSPEGRSVVFVRRGSSIVVTAKDGSGMFEVTNGREPAWSPDGSRIAYQGAEGISLIRPDGTGMVQLTHLGFAMSPAWSPDGTEVAFVASGRGYTKVFVMNADGSNVRQVSSGPGDDAHPVWSPDGSRLAFWRDPPYPG